MQRLADATISEIDESSVPCSKDTTNNIQQNSKARRRSSSTMPLLLYGIIFLVFTKSQTSNGHVIRVVHELTQQTCAENDSVTFDCGAAQSDRVTWYYTPNDDPRKTFQLQSNGSGSGTFVSSDPFNYSIVGYDRGLHIEAAKAYHSGRYTCLRASSGGRWIRPINRTTELRVIISENDGDVTLVRSADMVGWRREWDLVRGLIVICIMSLVIVVIYKVMLARKFRRENKQQDDEKSTSGLVADQTDELRFAID